MSADKIKTLLLGMASINKLLAAETAGDGYFEAVIDRMNDTLIMAGVGLNSMLRATEETQEFEALIVENLADTKELPVVRIYPAEVESWEFAK